MIYHTYHPSAPPASELADRLGLKRARLGEWRGTCPACGYPSAAVLSERGGRALLWCSSCADRAALAAALRGAAGGSLPAHRAERLPRLERADRAARIARAVAIWSGAEPITPDCPAALYLARRRIEHIATSAALRWRNDVPHPNGGRRIALLAAVSGADGNFQGLQRVFLKPDGTKADVEPQKASLGVIAGGAVRLQTASTELAIAEGIESAAAASALLNLPAWAAVSCGNLGNSLILPETIRSVTIAVDRDPAGERAARAAATRWQREGRAVRLATPRENGKDFNTLAMEGVR